jgi:hypothetical protein
MFLEGVRKNAEAAGDPPAVGTRGPSRATAAATASSLAIRSAW